MIKWVAIEVVLRAHMFVCLAKRASLIIGLLGMWCCVLSGTADTYTVIKPASKKQLVPIIEHIKKQMTADDIEGDFPNGLESLDGYKADINNDGKLEYIFLDHQGSSGGLVIFVYGEDEQGVHEIIKPTSVYDCGGEFVNPLTHENEFLVSAQGKTYMCFNGNTYQEPVRSVCLWKNDKINRYVDSFWIDQQRKLFKALYEHKRYLSAYVLLRIFEQKNRKSIDPQIDLWLRNDMALEAFKCGLPQTSLNVINDIKKEPAFKQAKPLLKRSVKTNEDLCLVTIEKDKTCGSKGKYDYNWLLSYRHSHGEIAWDERCDAFLSAVIPDIAILNVAVSDYTIPNLAINEQLPWSAVAKNYFYGPGEFTVAGPYVFFDGFWPHNANNHGFVWCDIQNKVSVAAFASCHYSWDENVADEQKGSLALMSRSLLVEELPSHFYTSLAQWMQKTLKIHTDNMPQSLFYDRFGKSHDVTDEIRQEFEHQEKELALSQ